LIIRTGRVQDAFDMD